MNETLYWAKVKDNDAIIPTKRDEDAGYDIYACFDENYRFIKANETVMIPTGIASCIPVGYYMQIEERGSSGSKGLKYSAGVFDAGFRGEWNLMATNTTDKVIAIIKKDFLESHKTLFEDLEKRGIMIIYPYEKAIFQAILHSTNNQIKPKEIPYNTLKDIPSERGIGRLGSSNK